MKNAIFLDSNWKYCILVNIKLQKLINYHIEDVQGILNTPPSRGLRPMEMPLNSQKKLGI